MLSIGVVSQQFGRVLSGPGLHTRNLVRHLIADGHQVTVIVPTNQRPTENMEADFVTVAAPKISSHARWLPLSWQFAQALARVEKTRAIDLWHFTDAREAGLVRTRTPIIGNINDTYAAEVQSLRYYRQYYYDSLTRWGYYRLLHLLDGWTWQRCTQLLANSQYTAQAVARSYPGLRAKLRVCYKSVAISDFATVRAQRENQPSHSPCVLYVGGNMQRKGVPDLIRSAPAVIAALPTVQFWIVGQDSTTQRLKMMGDELGIGQHLQFLGWKSRSELSELYAQASVFVMPSLTEAFGVAFLEAMAAGIPTVGTAVGGIPEIIQNGQNGLLVPPHAPAELAQALLTVLQSPELQMRFCEQGQITARRFSVEAMMSDTYAAYRQIFSRP